jgi:RNA polymerase sigma-70 factor (ECF subfamily)
MVMANLTPDQEWFQRFISSDPLAFNALHTEYAGRLRYFILQLGVSPLYAEDLVQDAFQVVWEKRRSFKDRQHVIHSLYFTSRNKALNFNRDNPSDLIFDPGKMDAVLQEPSIESAIIRSEVVAELSRHLEELPPVHRRILQYLQAGMSPAKIAEALGISVDNVYVKKHEALKKLRLRLFGDKK